MEGLCARPTMPVHPHDPTDLPGDPIRHQDLDRLGVVAIPPEDHDADLVVDSRNPHGDREIPLPSVSDPHHLAIRRWDRSGQGIDLETLPLPLDFAVALEVPDVGSGASEPIRLAMDVV